jgi:exodeoxyribonuclease VII large subunit
VEDAARRYKHVCQLLDSYSYENILKRGYAMVTDSAGHLVASAAEAKPGDAVDLRFHDGSRGAVIEGADAVRAPRATPARASQAAQTRIPEAAPAPARAPKRDGGSRGSSGGSSGNQGSLL